MHSGASRLGAPLPWPLRLVQRLYWLSLVGAAASVGAILVFAGAHDRLDPSGRRAWTTAAVLAFMLLANTVTWVCSLVGVQAWRRRWYEEVARQARPADPRDETYTGYKIAYLEEDRTPGGEERQLCFRPLNPRAAPYAVDAVSRCPREGVGALCSGHAHDGHRCGFHAVRDARLIGPGSPAQVEWDLDRQRRRSQVLLQVSLSGHVEPGEWGYRATEQQVLRVSFRRECSECRRSRRAGYLTVKRRAGHDLVVPVCRRHRRDALFGPIDLANRLGTEVGWIDVPG